MRKDFTHEKISPVLVCFLSYKDKYLLLKRSNKVLAYKNTWSNLAGFIDDEKSLREKIIEEVNEELGLEERDIIEVTEIEVYTFKDKDIGRDWIRHVFLVKISNPDIKLNWEHTDYKWVSPDEVKSYKTTPGLFNDLNKVIASQNR